MKVSIVLDPENETRMKMIAVVTDIPIDNLMTLAADSWIFVMDTADEEHREWDIVSPDRYGSLYNGVPGVNTFKPVIEK